MRTEILSILFKSFQIFGFLIIVCGAFGVVISFLDNNYPFTTFGSFLFFGNGLEALVIGWVLEEIYFLRKSKNI